MRDADTILGIIHERGTRGLPLKDAYRLLFQPALYLRAYGRIAKNAGAMTPGATAETVDGMSMAKIEAIIDVVRHERYRWTPARRVYIEKPNSTKKRPLGLPTWSDKLLQEVVRSILEAYYEPQFSPASHGFRPRRGCHTALMEVRQTWTGTVWFIEGDIAQCFDRLDHTVLLAILGEKIQDNRFLRLIAGLLAAGYLEEWKFNATLSGTPQGGVASPILANIYLDRLDQFVEMVLRPAYTRGTQRRKAAAYATLSHRAEKLRRRGATEEARALRKRYQALPARDPMDPGFRRLRYVRYADDFLLGFSGPKVEAEEIKRQLGEFLRESLKLELAEQKTLVTHARSEAAHFLGYEVVVSHDNRRRDKRGYRSLNGGIGLKVPLAVIRAKAAAYMRHGKPVHLLARSHHTPFSIIAQYQQEYRGVVDYYRLAYNLHRFSHLKWVMEQALTKTLATKLKLSVPQVYGRFATTLSTDRGPYKGLRVRVEREEGKRPLVAQWGGISLAWHKNATLDDQPRRVWNGPHTELVERLLADTCELCGSTDRIEVHHIRRLADLQKPGRGAKPDWVKRMAARHRKTLVVCWHCHRDIHNGRQRWQGLVE